MKWYKQLGVHQRIALKELSSNICGVSWDTLSLLFTLRERIELLYGKLKVEGFDV